MEWSLLSPGAPQRPHARNVSHDLVPRTATLTGGRSPLPWAWRTAEALARSTREIYEATLAGGGATFDPHTGRFLLAGADQGHSVGLVSGTALEAASTPAIAALTGLPLFEPRLIEAVVREYQDVYEDPDTVIGTWVDGAGVVHIDPAEVFVDVDEALLRAAVRGQAAVFHLGCGEITTSACCGMPVAA